MSWWDAFTLREVQRILRPRGPIYTLMTERELRRLPFFGMIGAFGVDPERPGSVLEAVRFFAGEARRRPDATLNFFPQGRIWPSHRRPLGFERGVELFARRVAPCTILPVALHHEPLAAPAPTVFVSCGEPVRVDGGRVDAAALEHAVEGEIDRILHFLSTHGEEAGAQWPGAFERLEPPPVAAWR